MDSFTLHIADALVNLTGGAALGIVWVQHRRWIEFGCWSMALFLFSLIVMGDSIIDLHPELRGLQTGILVFAVCLWGAGFRSFEGTKPIQLDLFLLPVASVATYGVAFALTRSVQIADASGALFWLIAGCRVIHFVGWRMAEPSFYRKTLKWMMIGQMTATLVLMAVVAPMDGKPAMMLAVPLIDLMVTAVTLTALLGMTVERQFRTVERLAYQDPLTGIANRAGLKQRSANASSGCVLVVDLDHFKQINDRYGHDGGDQVLCRFVERTQALLPENAIFSRIGGEEFLVLLPAKNMLEARLVANQICLSFRREAVRIDGGDVALTTSIGVGHLAEGEALEIAMKRADLALYEAKTTGRDQVRYSTPSGSRYSALNGLEQVVTLA